MFPGKVKIVKSKNWKDEENPNQKVMKYKLVQGCKFITTTDWKIEEKLG